MPRKIPHSPETQFKKGQTGNPNGRPKKLPELNVLLAEVLGEEKDGKTAAQAILMKLRQMATTGNVRAAELLMDRAWGKAKQAIELDGNLNVDQKTTVIPDEKLSQLIDSINSIGKD